MPRFLGFLLVAVWALALCACGRDQRDGENVLAEYDRLRRSATVRLTLTRRDSFALGKGRDSSVQTVSSVASSSGHYYVLDARAKRVGMFDGSWAYLRGFGRWGQGPGEFRSPLTVIADSSGVYVADPGLGPVVSRFTLRGEWAGVMRLPVGSGPMSFALDQGRAYVMEFASTDPANRERDLVTVMDRDGTVSGRGCRRDVRYLESRDRRGMMASADFGRVAARGGVVYCVQAISPVVQILGARGGTVRLIRTAPPFYQPPVDRPLSTSQKQVFDFLSSWTAHADIFPLPDGFASVYSRFDLAKGEARYSLFICRESRPRCGTVEGIRKPVHMPDAETVIVAEAVETDGPAKVGVYAIGGWEGE